MKNAFEYKGYVGAWEIDPDDDAIVGDVIGIRDVITFEGMSVAEARQAFRDSVDEYLRVCESHGKAPDRPFCGQFVVRVPPTLHRAASLAAADAGQSLDAWVAAALAGAAGVPLTDDKQPLKTRKAPAVNRK